MSQIHWRLIPLLVLLVAYPGDVSAQQPNRLPPILQGDAVVTGFSGTVAPDPARVRALNRPAVDLTFINPDGPSMRVIDMSSPGFVWDGRLFASPKTFDVPAKDIGQVFGVALDDDPSPNIYVAATSAFGLHLVARGRDGQPERRKKGGPGVGWMTGQFGLDLQGGPGSIYKIDGQTGVVTLFANVTLDGVPNPGPGLGNLAYDAAHKQLLVSDLYTGMIHRFGLDGRDLGAPFDHGVAGLTAAKQLSQPFNPRNRPNIASDRFDAENPTTWGYAPPARRVWGLTVYQDRLYYSVAAGPQIWSVGIAQDGSFAADPRWELDVPAQSGPLPVSDIAFSHRGAMILAQRALIAGAYDYAAFTRPGEPKVLRFWLKGPGDPPSPGRWKPAPEEYAVGFAGTYRNTNGGVALGYGYDREGKLSIAACEFSLWTTAQNIRNAPALRDRLDPGGPLIVHGIQGFPSSPVRTFNEPPWTSYPIDYDGTFDDPRAAGHLGSVRIYTRPCDAPTARYRGPGARSNPPYVVDPPTVTAGCTGSTCPPPDCVFGVNCPPAPTGIDLGIGKIGENNPNNPYGPYNFTIGVRNLGNAINTAQTITVTDVVPAGMTFTNVTSANWTCSPIVGPPILAGGTLTCTYTGSFPIAANQLLGTIDIVGTGGDGPFENCASLAPGDRDSSNDRACVTVKKPDLDVKLEKKVKDRTGPHTIFEIDVSNVGIAFTNGVFTVTDSVPSGMTVMTASAPWSCNPLPVTGAGTMTCTLSVASIPLNHTLPPLTIMTMLTGGGPWENCALVAVATTSGTDTNPSNDNGCATVSKDPVGEIIVIKKVIYNGPLVMPSLIYPVTVTCGSWSQNFNLLPNVPQSSGGVPQNTACNLIETLPPAPASACPAPKVPVWQTPPSIVPANSFQLTGATLTVTVTNTLDCKDEGKDGSLIVKKEVINNTGLSTTGMVFPISTSCQSGTDPAVVTAMPLQHNATQTVSGLALNTKCDITEGPIPPLPPSAALCATGLVPTWTTILPAQVTITGPGMMALVQNILDCKRPDGGDSTTFTVKKEVVNKEPLRLNAPGPYTATVSCVVGSNLAVTTGISLADGGSQTVNNVAVNSNCTVTEFAPPAATGTCPTEGDTPTWTIEYLPSKTVNVGTTGGTVLIRNTLECKPADKKGYYRVSKIIDNRTSNSNAYLDGLVFPVISTCDGNTVALNVTRLVPGIVTGIPVGAVCSVVETLPPAPTTGCPAGKVATWGTQTYTPETRTIAYGAGPIIQIKNFLTCEDEKRLLPPVCKPPLVQGNRPGVCVCPPGTVKKGQDCVRLPDCKPPMVPGAAPGLCVCPSGTERKGRDCVRRQAECIPPAKRGKRGACECPTNMIASGSGCVPRDRRQIPDGVIKNIPGGFGPGGGGREGPGGGGRGGPAGGPGGGGYVPPGGGGAGGSSKGIGH